MIRQIALITIASTSLLWFLPWVFASYLPMPSFLFSTVASIFVLTIPLLIWQPTTLLHNQQLVIQNNATWTDSGLRGGLAWTRRFIERPVLVDVEDRRIDFTNLSGMTMDAVFVTMNGFYILRIENLVNRAKAPYECDKLVNQIVLVILQNRINAYNLRNALVSRPSIVAEVINELNLHRVLRSWGLSFFHFEIVSISIPPEAQNILAREMLARLMGPAMVLEGENAARTLDVMQTIVRNDTLLAELLRNIGTVFKK